MFKYEIEFIGKYEYIHEIYSFQNILCKIYLCVNSESVEYKIYLSKGRRKLEAKREKKRHQKQVKVPVYKKNYNTK